MRFGERFATPPRRRHRGALIAFVTIAALGALALGLRWKATSETPPAPSTTSEPQAPHPDRAVDPPAGDALPAPSPAPPSPAASPSARLRREYGDAADLYAFAEAARRRPREGGLFYALQAAEHCRFANARLERRLRDPDDEPSPVGGAVDPRRGAMLERYARRCAGFRPLDLEAYWTALRADPAAADDPLVVAAGAISKTAQGSPARIAAIHGLLDLHDPSLLSSKFVYLMNPDRIDGSPGGLWLDGHDYRRKRQATDVYGDYGLYLDAIERATCDPGAPCRLDDTVLMSCRWRSVCNDSIDDDLYPDEPGVDPSVRRRYWADVRELTGRMRSAIGRGDLDAFRVPRTPAAH